MPRSPEPQLVAVPDQNNDADDNDNNSDSGSDGDDGEQEVYEVEAIHASRYDPVAKSMRYLIKWKGYPEDEKTWEPLENLSNCTVALRKYEKMKAERDAKAAQKIKAAQRAKTKASASQNPDNDKDDDDANDQGLSMKELDARRAQAKEKAKTKRRASAPARSEDLVAQKWEQKANKEARKPRASTSSVPSASAKRKAQSPPPSSSREAKKSSNVRANGTAPRAAKKLSQIIGSDSDEDDVPPSSNTLGAQPTQPAPSTQQSAASTQTSTQSTSATTPASTSALPAASGADQATPAPSLVQQSLTGVTTVNPAATLLNGSAATVTPSSSSLSTSRSTDPRKNALAAPAGSQAPPAKPGKGPWDNPQLGDLFSSYKAKPAAPAPPPPPPAAPPVDDSYNNRVRFATNPLPSVAVRPAGRAMSPPVRAPSALEIVSALSSGRRSASPALSTNGPVPAVPSASMAAHEPTQNGTVAASQNGRTSSSEGTPVVSPSAEAKKAQEEQRKMRLRTIENRLKGSSWYELQRMSDEESLVVACAETVPMDPQLALRLRTKSVALLYSSDMGDRVSGEGLALTYLLLATGSKTPEHLSDLDALFLHREESPVKLEGLYNELVNLERSVEFFSFGNGELIASILSSGYLVIPTFDALRLAAAFERYCSATAQVFGRTCMTTVHPASIARAREFPNWYRIVEAINNQSISMVDRTQLRVGSHFVTTESTTLLFPGIVPPVPIPQITAEEEVSEILEHLRFARAKSLSTWRRFVIVVGDSTPEVVDRAGKLGIEVHTWTSLGTLVEAHPFG